MESALLGLVLDSSVPVAAERQKLTTPETISRVRETVGDVTIVICPMTGAELAWHLPGRHSGAKPDEAAISMN